MKNNYILITFFTSLILSVTGAWMMIIHAQNAEAFMVTGLFTSFVALSLLMFEMMSSRQINRGAKLKWTLAFLAFGWFALLFYVLGMKNREEPA